MLITNNGKRRTNMSFFPYGMMCVLDNRATNEQRDIANEVADTIDRSRYATREDVYYITLDALTDDQPMITCNTNIETIIDCVDEYINNAVCDADAYDDHCHDAFGDD